MATALLTDSEMTSLMEQLRDAAYGELLPGEREFIHHMVETGRAAGLTDLQVGVLVMTITQPIGRKQKDYWSSQLVRFLGE